MQLHQVAMAEPATNSGSNSSTKKDNKPDICDPNTMRFKTTALSSPTDKARAAKALANLRGLMQPIRNAGAAPDLQAEHEEAARREQEETARREAEQPKKKGFFSRFFGL